MATTRERVARQLRHDGSRAPRRRLGPAVSGDGSALVAAIYARDHQLVERLGLGREHLTLHELAALGDAVGVRVRLEGGDDPRGWDPLGWTTLHHASALGHEPVVATLLEWGLDPDMRSRVPRTFAGTTSLHLAVAGQHGAVARTLLLGGAAPSLRDDAGYAPLHLAAELGHIGLVKALLRAGARINPLVGDATPLTLALRHRHLHVAALLRQCGASV